MGEILLNALLFCVIISMPFVLLAFVGWMIAAVFSSKVRTAILRHLELHFIWLLVSLVTFAILMALLGSPYTSQASLHKAKTQGEFAQIQSALQNYRTEYSTLPAGNDNAGLFRALEGDNPKKIVFLELKETQRNSNGEMLDGWEQPLRITLTDPQHPLIQSAGPDKKWNTPDDMSTAQDK